ncbi:MAG: AbrB/MazE/SpoVT family DNA-binding domain-containing protein [Gammaproteobacteria bacterium]
MAHEATISSKGQLVIPARLRRRLGIRKGTKVHLIEEGDRLILQPVTREFIRKLRGSLKGTPSILDKLLKERRREGRREELRFRR